MEGERSENVSGYAPKNYHLTCKVRVWLTSFTVHACSSPTD